LPFVATLLRATLRTTGFYFPGTPKDYRWAERKVEGEDGHAPEPAASGAEEFSGKQPSLAVWSEATEKEMTHRFPCQDAFASNRWISFLAARYCSYSD
jgi:hypothetical protein